MRNRRRILLSLLLIVGLASAGNAYTVLLKDGSQLIAQKAPTINGDQAIIILQSGTPTSIAASEIDFPRTRKANEHELGSAMVLENGEFTNTTVTPEPAPREKSLTELTRKATAANRAPVSRGSKDRRSTTGSTEDLANFQRTPYRNLSVLEAIQGAFRSQGVERAKVFQGTADDRLLIEVETNSEAAVFRSLKVAAGALAHVRSNISAEIDAFELVLATSNRSRAGQFVMSTEDATAIASGQLEVSTYFIEHVRF